MINFLGRGSAFNSKLGNNSAFIKSKHSLLLIDAGGIVFHRLQQLDLLDDIDEMHVIITHLHPDHVGSLGDIIFYLHYRLNKKLNLYFPNGDRIKEFLSNVGVDSSLYKLIDKEQITIKDKELGDISLSFILVSHVKTVPCYGFIMNIKGDSFYYSGDSNNIEKTIIDKLQAGEINRIYQDTSGLNYKGNAHLYIKKLEELISVELRNRVYSMHLDGHITEEEIKAKGFKVVKEYK